MTADFARVGGGGWIIFWEVGKMKNKINLALKNAIMMYKYVSGKDYKSVRGYKQARTIDAAFYLGQIKMCEQLLMK